MCQPMPTGLYTRWDFDSETSRFTPRQNKTQRFEKMVMPYFQRTRPDCLSFFTTGRQKKIDCLSVDGFVLIATMCLKPWVSFTTSLRVKSCVPLSLKRIFNVAVGKENSMN